MPTPHISVNVIIICAHPRIGHNYFLPQIQPWVKGFLPSSEKSKRVRSRPRCGVCCNWGMHMVRLNGTHTMMPFSLSPPSALSCLMPPWEKGLAVQAKWPVMTSYQPKKWRYQSMGLVECPRWPQRHCQCRWRHWWCRWCYWRCWWSHCRCVDKREAKGDYRCIQERNGCKLQRLCQ